jgi:hypothetical protein
MSHVYWLIAKQRDVLSVWSVQTKLVPNCLFASDLGGGGPQQSFLFQRWNISAISLEETCAGHANMYGTHGREATVTAYETLVVKLEVRSSLGSACQRAGDSI